MLLPVAGVTPGFNKNQVCSDHGFLTTSSRDQVFTLLEELLIHIHHILPPPAAACSPQQNHTLTAYVDEKLDLLWSATRSLERHDTMLTLGVSSPAGTHAKQARAGTAANRIR